MGKFYITLISLCGILLSCQIGWAQCPEKEQVQVQLSTVQSFEQNEGVITFSISDRLTFERDDYRIRLWDESRQTYVYDDNAPSFLNVPELIISGRTMSFSNLPKGDYMLELHGNGCQHRRFVVERQSKIQSN